VAQQFRPRTRDQFMWGVTTPPYNMNRTGSHWEAVEASYPYPARMEGSL